MLFGEPQYTGDSPRAGSSLWPRLCQNEGGAQGLLNLQRESSREEPSRGPETSTGRHRINFTVGNPQECTPSSSLLLPSDLLWDLPTWRPLWRPRKCEPSQSASWSREQGKRRWKVDLKGQRESINSELLIWDFLPRKDYPGSKMLSITFLLQRRNFPGLTLNF